MTAEIRNASASRAQKVLRGIRTVLLLAFAAVVLLLIVVYLLMRASLPQLDGDLKLPGLKSPVIVNRDARGTVQVNAQDMVDAVRALGYVHAQERFFEMDLARRSAAGELSALFGKVALDADQGKRVHQFRARMASAWPSLPDKERAMLTAYAEGVNAGVAGLSWKPWQYLILQCDPLPWREVDSLLVIAEMYSMLQLGSIQAGFAENVMLAQLQSQWGVQAGDMLFNLLRPRGGELDGALDGSVVAAPPLPGADLIDTRKPAATTTAMSSIVSDSRELKPGSNNWAVGGALSPHGAGILANDMHLNLGVPNIWFRAEFNIKTPTGNRRITGVTLPGIPALVAGSNGDIAWGYTNSYGKWFEWIPLDAGAAGKYKTGLPGSGGEESFITHHETIAIKGARDAELDVRTTRWGPVARNWNGKPVALWWTAHEPGAINAKLFEIMFATNVDEAMAIAQSGGMPHQNLLVVDKSGAMGWTIAGRMFSRPPTSANAPRAGFASVDTVPAVGDIKWLPARDVPAIRNPPDHRLWTANNRQLGGAPGALIGDGGFDLGARAQQIRDRLKEKDKFDERSLYAIQLDDEARFMKRWAALAGATANAAAANDPAVAAAAKLLTAWNGRADVDQTGYRIARAFRLAVLDELWKSWLAALSLAPPAAGTTSSAVKFSWDARFESAAWLAQSAKAPNLLPAAFKTWDEFMAAQLGKVIKDLTPNGEALDTATWGQRNQANIRHPFSRVLPLVGRVLDMPATAQPGDAHMPRVAGTTFGASERMVVAPGHEERAILTMPGGQSGHPLSPFYGAGHQDWLDGKAAPLLAGETRYTLKISP